MSDVSTGAHKGTEEAPPRSAVAARLTALAHEIDLASWSLNDGSLGRIAIDLESLARELAPRTDPASTTTAALSVVQTMLADYADHTRDNEDDSDYAQGYSDALTAVETALTRALPPFVTPTPEGDD